MSVLNRPPRLRYIILFDEHCTTCHRGPGGMLLVCLDWPLWRTRGNPQTDWIDPADRSESDCIIPNCAHSRSAHARRTSAKILRKYNIARNRSAEAVHTHEMCRPVHQTLRRTHDDSNFPARAAVAYNDLSDTQQTDEMTDGNNMCLYTNARWLYNTKSTYLYELHKKRYLIQNISMVFHINKFT